ncbi:MAG: efflux RND transporter periplasmic adaptor subunit [Verrucomicrobiota bacterium]
MRNKSIAVFILLLAAASLLPGCHPASNPISGTIEVDEAHVASRYGGRVEKIYADEGAVLKAGDPIIDLEATELKARRDSMAAQLEELEHGPRPSEIEAAKQDWQALSAQLEFARDEAKRQQDLLKQKTVSSSDSQRAGSVANALEKSAFAAQKRYELLVEGTRPERVAQARAQLAEIDTQLAEMHIIAPGESILEVLEVKVGDVLPANREVATLILPQHLWVRVYVPESWLGRIKIGDEVRVNVDSWPGTDFKGVVEQINRQAEFTPRNVQTVEERVKQVFGIKIKLDNRENKLRAGMSADVVFPEAGK